MMYVRTHRIVIRKGLSSHGRANAGSILMRDNRPDLGTQCLGVRRFHTYAVITSFYLVRTDVGLSLQSGLKTQDFGVRTNSSHSGALFWTLD